MSLNWKLIRNLQGDRGGAGASFTDEAWTLDGVIAGGPMDCDFSEMVRNIKMSNKIYINYTI